MSRFMDVLLEDQRRIDDAFREYRHALSVHRAQMTTKVELGEVDAVVRYHMTDRGAIHLTHLEIRSQAGPRLVPICEFSPAAQLRWIRKIAQEIAQ